MAEEAFQMNFLHITITPSWFNEPRGYGDPRYYLEAARVPKSLKPQNFGPWTIRRIKGLQGFNRHTVGWSTQTLLHYHNGNPARPAYPFDGELPRLATFGTVVMEDSRIELQKHLPIWMEARGRVLVTGLGLGCVVRGLLANRDVDHIDVVELDRHILRIVGHEFRGNKRVTLHHGDALRVTLPGRWDFAWHDLYVDDDKDDHLQVLHSRLTRKFWNVCGKQGAWERPRFLKRLMPANRIIG